MRKYSIYFFIERTKKAYKRKFQIFEPRRIWGGYKNRNFKYFVAMSKSEKLPISKAKVIGGKAFILKT